MTSWKTPLVRYPPIVMLIALEDAVARECTAALAPLPTIRVAHLAAAIERLLVVHPLAMVVETDPLLPELTVLRERAGDIAAVVVGLEGLREGPLLVLRLKAAVEEAERLRG